MGMSKQEKALYEQILASINKMSTPQSNPAADFLNQQAMAGADWLTKGDFKTLPKGMFFDFQMPAEQINQYKKLTNVGKGGTFALANNSGRSQAQSLAGQYLGDKFARDAGQNYQNNISNAAGNVRTGLAQSAGATAQNQSMSVNALTNLMQAMPKKKGFDWGSLASGILGAI